MKYNKDYDRWVSKDGLVYRYDKKTDRLILCKLGSRDGYNTIHAKLKYVSVHRMVWETFVGKIPDGYEIDHINTIRDDNRLENLRCVTPKENSNNPLTRKHKSKSFKGITKSSFGIKFFEHYGITQYQNVKLYHKEYLWYSRHKKCRWE